MTAMPAVRQNRAATYPDRETAQWATQRVVTRNEQVIHRWLDQVVRAHLGRTADDEEALGGLSPALPADPAVGRRRRRAPAARVRLGTAGRRPVGRYSDAGVRRSEIELMQYRWSVGVG